MSGEPDEVLPDAMLEALADVAALARCAQRAGDVRARRAAARVADWFARGACESIDVALGLRRRGGKSASHALRLAERDRTIRWLRRRCWPGEEDAAGAMAAAWRRYTTDRWPRELTRIEPPAAEPAGTFWGLLRDGHDPLDARQLARILAAAEPDIQSHVWMSGVTGQSSGIGGDSDVI